MKSYDNDEIRVTFDAGRCIHSGVCLKRLPEVFNLLKRPWINVDGASVEDIKEAIDACPSGALQYHDSNQEASAEEKRAVVVRVMEHGPCVINEDVEIVMEDGYTIPCEGGCALCRCGNSRKKPFCDGSHMRL